MSKSEITPERYHATIAELDREANSLFGIDTSIVSEQHRDEVKQMLKELAGSIVVEDADENNNGDTDNYDSDTNRKMNVFLKREIS